LLCGTGIVLVDAQTTCTYTVSFTASGTLGGTPFTNQLVYLSFTGNNPQQTEYSTTDFYLFATTTNTVTIGATTTEFNGATYGVFVNAIHNWIGFADITTNLFIEATVTTVADTYNLDSSIGPVIGPIAFDGVPYPTQAGPLIINSVSSDPAASTFYAVCNTVSGCLGLWNCSGCAAALGTVTVTAVNTGGTTPCAAVTNLFPTSCADEITVFSQYTNQFYTVQCLDGSGNPVGVTCTETCVINFAGSAGSCTTTGSNFDYLRTDNEVPTYGCTGTVGTCAFTSSPGTADQYYYDVSGSGDFGGNVGTVSTSASTPDCICENTGATPSGKPATCTSFTSTTIKTTDPASFGA